MNRHTFLMLMQIMKEIIMKS